MFEAIVMLCLGAGEGPCREVLLPGYEAASELACVQGLEAQPPDTSGFSRTERVGDVLCQPVGAALPLTEIAPGVHVHRGRIEEPDADNRGDVSNLAIVIGARSVAVIDTGSARWIGEAAWRAIRARTPLPVSHVILTHMHPDHVFGASAFPDAEVIGHAKLPRALADRQENYAESMSRLLGPAFIGSTAPEVTQPVAEVTEIDLGDRILRIEPHPTAHTETDLTVTDVQTGTLIAGDLLFHLHTPALDGSLRGWQAVMADLRARSYARVVPGHGDPSLPWPEGAGGLMRYLDTLATDTRAAIAEGARLGTAVDHIAENERPHWQLFDAYNPRNATVAFTELEWE